MDGGQMNSLAAAGGEKCWRTGDEGQAGVVLQALGGSPPEPAPSLLTSFHTLLSLGSSIHVGGNLPCPLRGAIFRPPPATANPRDCLGWQRQVHQQGSRSHLPGRCRWRWTGRVGSGHSTGCWDSLCATGAAGLCPWHTGWGERQKDEGLEAPPTPGIPGVNSKARSLSHSTTLSSSSPCPATGLSTLDR